MSQNIIIDEDSKALSTSFALIKTPRKSRKRYPEGIVTVVASKEEALRLADDTTKTYAAKVYGPSPSSENVKVYYLMEWI